ncbi:MAG: UDP-N-acetylglucosamine 4,6-dehydratase [bacterium]
MDNLLSLIGREHHLFENDMSQYADSMHEYIHQSRFLVLGAAGSIGQAVTKAIFQHKPRKLHAIDISENNLTELVRDIRSTFGYIDGDFQSFALDIGSSEFSAFMQWDGHYDYVLNLSALKHVRSEKDPFTLMRMIDVNIFNTDCSIRQSIAGGAEKYFCVSTDKAANPVNMMGASKRIMEMFLQRHSHEIAISTARFANVAFSDGSLLYSFDQRLRKQQPLVAPQDIKRYFVTPEESGQLCLLSCLFGDNRDIFFPKLSSKLHLTTFSDIAIKYLQQRGFEPFLCESEHQARELVRHLPRQGQWPCLFTNSDTTGEKDFEEFFTAHETLDMDRFADIGIIKNGLIKNSERLAYFERTIQELRTKTQWDKNTLVHLFNDTLPEFQHKETGKYLDGKM